MCNSDFDQKNKFFKLKNQVFQSLDRLIARKLNIFITNFNLTVNSETKCVVSFYHTSL